MENQTLTQKPEEKIRLELEKINLADKAIAEFQKKYMVLKVAGLNDKEGLEKVHEARIEVRNARTGVIKYCKQAREAANAYSKAVIAEEKRIVGLIEPIETYLEEQESVVEKEKERIRMEEEAKEQARIKGRIAKLVEFKVQYDGSNYSYADQSISMEQIDIMIDERFDEFVTQVKVLHDAEQEKKRQEEAAAKEAREKMERIAAEQKKEAERLEIIRKEQEVKDAAVKAEREKLEAEKKALEDAKVKAEQEKHRAIELEAAKKKAAEEAIVAEQERIKKNAEAIAEAERKAKEETARQEALRPDKEKLLAFADAITVIPIPKVTGEGPRTILNQAIERLNACVNALRITTKTL